MTVVEVGSGLNFLDANGNFQPAQDLIQIQQDGSAAALYGVNKVYFSPDLSADGAITLVTKSNRVFQTHPVGLYYVDGNNSVLLAPVQDAAVAELIPPNSVAYRGAFATNGFTADLLLTYTKQGLESDVLLTRKPKGPEAYGLKPQTALLQVRHAWLNAPMPKVSYNTLDSGLVDETLDFGELWFPTGTAFTWTGAENLDTNVAARLHLPGMDDDGTQIPVAKEWQQVATGVSFLTESVPWQELQPQLSNLPTTAQNSPKPKIGQLAGLELKSAPAKKSFQLATEPRHSTGVLLDYVTVVGGGNYTFTNGTTFYLSNGCTFSSITFQAGAVLRYDTNGYLSAYTSISCPTSGNAIMSAAGDNQYGQPFSTNPNPQYYNRALIIYQIPNTVIQNLQVRWASIGPYFLYSTSDTLSNSSLFECLTGVKAESGSGVTITNSTQCVVTTPTTVVSGSTITGTR